MKKLLYTFAFLSFLAISISLDAKRPLNHDDFDAWQRVNINSISRNGNWSAFSVTPQEGDAVLTFRNNRTKKEISIPRGYKPSFTSDGKWAIALIKPFFKDSRQAKIDKKKDYESPKDSLVIIELDKLHIEKIPNVLNYKIGEKGGTFLAYQSCDTLHIKEKDFKDKESGRPLMVRSLTTPTQKIVKWVKDYNFSKDGRKLALKIQPSDEDSLSTKGLALIDLPDTSLILFDREKKHYSLPVFNEDGSALAYTSSQDTIETGTRHDHLFYLPLKDLIAGGRPTEISVDYTTGIPLHLNMPNMEDSTRQDEMRKEWVESINQSKGEKLQINQYSIPQFSKNGRFLIVGVAPVIAPDDTTLVDFETAELDIWRWNAPMTPPQEKANLDKLVENTYPVVIDLNNHFNQQLLTKKGLDVIEPSFGWNSEWALIHDPEAKIVSRQWDYLAPEELYAVNVSTGKRIPLGEADNEGSNLSPDGRFVVTFKDRNYYAYDISNGRKINLSEKIPYPVWDEEEDCPLPSQPYGIAGWGESDNRLLIYDKYDIWSVDMTGDNPPVNLTAEYGRKNNRQLRYKELDNDEKPGISNGEVMVLEVLDFTTKQRGLATLNYSINPASPKLKLLDNYKITQLTKADDADVYVWQRANFNTMPDLWTSNNTDFAKGVKITSSNPQFKDISWGTAELVEWHTFDGKTAQGVLYLPEDFNPTEGSYPMLSVFYEKNSEELFTHYTMEPSWSWVNYPFYVSRGYVVFVPDIHYTAGIPGNCAYNYVCSGVEEMLKRYPSIDPKRLGIDGQSWGGYQTAYLITQTNMFACAGSGAPVANMTSAYGGIRWGSGDSRQAQYEQGQSRIGKSLWEAPELYIANSPLFNADKVETPLLIMHNDADGAVPWYQGIELFMALRRLEKPVWMLQYNGELHNIKARKNRKDITKRLQQFFDHYLKGEPMPRWMKEGISPLRKGQDLGF